MTIRNFTAHPICFYSEEDVHYVSNIRKYVAKKGSAPKLTIESEGMLSIEFENEKIKDEPVPIYRRFVSRVDSLPEIEPGQVVVVSAVFATSRKIIDSSPYPLYTVKDTVYDEVGKPIGCLGLLKV